MYIDETNIIEDVDEQIALACLLANGTCIINVIDITHAYNVKDDKKIYTTAVYVLVSDIFVWGAADAEPIICNDGETPNDIIDLYKLQKDIGFFGLVQWVCVRRNIQPQNAIKQDMINLGFWNDIMDKLPPNTLL